MRREWRDKIEVGTPDNPHALPGMRRYAALVTRTRVPMRYRIVVLRYLGNTGSVVVSLTGRAWGLRRAWDLATSWVRSHALYENLPLYDPEGIPRD